MRLSLFSAALFASGISVAATPVDGWYAAGFGGYSYLPGNVYNTTAGLLRENTAYRGGYNAGGSFGFKSNPFRYEGEITYIHANLKHFSINYVPQSGYWGGSSALTAMANIYYDFPEMVPCIEPYLGIGLGYAYVEARLNNDAGPAGATSFKASDNVFAYQGMAGVTYNFAENYAATLGYKYLATGKADQLGKIFQAHVASAGVVYRFDESSYK